MSEETLGNGRLNPRTTTKVYVGNPAEHSRHIDVDVDGERKAYFPDEPGVTLETIIADVTERVKAGYEEITGDRTTP